MCAPSYHTPRESLPLWSVDQGAEQSPRNAVCADPLLSQQTAQAGTVCWGCTQLWPSVSQGIEESLGENEYPQEPDGGGEEDGGAPASLKTERK